jgi:flagellar biosynthesis/type III secretory pathway protein FliH
MAGTFTVNLLKPVTSVAIIEDRKDMHCCDVLQNDTSTTVEPCNNNQPASAIEMQPSLKQDLHQQNAELKQVCQTLNNLVDKLNKFYSDVLSTHKEQIAKLSIEIARKILMQKIHKGDYEIEPIIEEVLKNAPAHQELVVHVNPTDLAQCQKIQQDDPNGALASIKFVADANIGRAECLLESPKGIIKSFIEEHMERISEALSKME